MMKKPLNKNIHDIAKEIVKSNGKYISVWLRAEENDAKLLITSVDDILNDYLLFDLNLENNDIAKINKADILNNDIAEIESVLKSEIIVQWNSFCQKIKEDCH